MSIVESILRMFQRISFRRRALYLTSLLNRDVDFWKFVKKREKRKRKKEKGE